MLVGGNDPSSTDPFVWWYGLDGGAGSYAIGPNGPWTSGRGGVAAVTRATALITDPLSQVRWMVQRDVEEQVPVEKAPRWVNDPQLLRPDLRSGVQSWPHTKRRNRAAFWADAIRNALWWGMGIVMYAENEFGEPMPGSFYNIHRYGYDLRDGVLEIGDGSGDRIQVDYDGRFRLGRTTFGTIILRNPASPVDEDGRSFGVFEMHPDTFGLVGKISEFERGSFGSGVPAGYLKTQTPGMTQTQADELKAKWMAAHGGTERSIAVLNATTEFTPISMSPIDMNLVEMKKVSLVEIANGFNLDPNMLGGPSGDSATYANVESRYSHYRVHTLGRWQTDIEETVGSLLPYGRDIRIRLQDLLRADTTTRYSQYASALQSKWMTVDEVRESEGLPLMPEEDKVANIAGLPPELQQNTGLVPVPNPEEEENEDDDAASA